MAKLFQIGGMMLIGAAVLLADQSGSKAKGEAWAPIPKGGGVPKAQPRVPPLRNPGSPAARLYRATPEERERALEKLPLNMQERIRKELQWFDNLPKDQQEIALKRSEKLAALPPDQQLSIRKQLQALNRLEPERRRAVRNALIRLQSVSEDQRKELLARPQFRGRFSDDEWRIVMDLSAVMIPQ
jgi:hypothetical protein